MMKSPTATTTTTISSQEKNWISDFTRKKGLDFIPTTQKQSNGIGSWVEMGKVAKEEEGIEEVFKYLLLYNTTSAHIVAESSKMFVRTPPWTRDYREVSPHMECLVWF